MNILIKILKTKNKKYICLALIQAALLASVVYSLNYINSYEYRQRLIKEDLIRENLKAEVLAERQRVNRINALNESRRKNEEQRKKQAQIENEKRRLENLRKQREQEAKKIHNVLSEVQINMLKAGMTKAHVRTICGTPDSTLSTGSIINNTMYYYGPVSIRFNQSGEITHIYRLQKGRYILIKTI